MWNCLPSRCVLLLVALTCVGAQTPSRAQTSIPPPAIGAATQLIPRVPAAPPEYTLGPGDQIVLHVVDMEEISDKPMRIDPSGFVDLTLVGRLQAAGLTTEQLKAELAKRLSRYISQPQITVNLLENQTRTVSVIGSVNSPGVHALQGPRHLIDALSEAGGVKADAGPRVVVTREMRWGALPLTGATTDSTGHFSTGSLALDDVLGAKNPADNILIEPGDVISVPKGEIVYVVGEVKRAGGFPLNTHESISLLQALSLAEGMGSEASGGKARILRPTPGNDGRPKEIPVDINKIYAGKSADVPLFANDILFVPNSAVKSTTRRAAEAALQVATGVIIYRR